MTWDEILELLEQGEGQSVEFEKNVPAEDDIARELVAFANADGGKIIYGIDDKNKHLIGIDVDDRFQDWIKQIGEKHCTPAITPAIELLARGEKKIAIISVPEGLDKPYKSDEICYIRDGSLSRPTKENEEKELANPWSGKGLNRRQIRTLHILGEHGSITNREFREAFSVSHKTAHLELTMLEDKGLVKSEGAGRSTRYILIPQPEA